MADGDLYVSGVDPVEGLINLQADDGGSVSMPDGHSLADASFNISDGDLMISWPDGMRASLEGFEGDSPTLSDGDGISLSPDMTIQLAQVDVPDAPQSVYSFDPGSDVILGTDGSAIGNVDDVSGSVWSVRVDGTRVELNVGDPVFQGDTLESGPDGSIGIILADETTFSMGEDGLMVLDEMIYDPATQEGSVSISALEGVFSFVSGQVAKMDPDAMTIDTPVATIGIRGTQVGLNLNDEDGMKIILMEEADGFVGEVVVQNEGGVVILNTAFAGTNVGDYGSTPSASATIDKAEFLRDFGSALKALPAANNANTYGVDEANLQMMIEDAIQEIEEAVQELEEEAAAEELAAEEAAEEEIAEEVAEELADETEAAAAAEEEAEEVVEEEIVEDVVVEDVISEDDGDNFLFGDDNTDTFEAPPPVFQEIVTPPPVQQEGLPEKEEAVVETQREEVVVDRGPALDGEGRIIVNPSNPNVNWAGSTAGLSLNAGGSDNDYSVVFGSGSDKIITGAGDDFLFAGDGNDIVNAGDGDDVIQGAGGRGDDIYNGNAGNDWVIYPSARDGYDLQINLDTTAVDLTLADGSFVHMNAESATDASDAVSWIDDDTLISIENAMGGESDDVISGSDADNTLVGNLGDDALFGGAGDDTLIGGSSYDNADGTVGGRDYIALDPQSGGGGNDYLDGGVGFDTVVYAGTFGDYTFRANSDNQVEVVNADGTIDTLVNIEDLQFSDGSTVAVGLPPVLAVSPAAGNEDQAISLDVATSFADDIGELGSVSMTGIPAGSTFMSGTEIITIDFTNPESGVVTLSPAQLTNLSITPPENFGSDFTLQVTAQSVVGLNSTTQSLSIDVTPQADAPVLNILTSNIGLENATSASFELSTFTTDASESITSVVVSGVPFGSKLFVLTDDGIKLQVPVISGVASIPLTYVGTVIVENTDGFTEDFSLVVSSTSTEPDGGDTATTYVGSDIAETIVGTDVDDVMYGLDGNDTLTGGGGTDTLYAGGGDDIVTGGTGVDTIFGASGDDDLSGYDGADMLYGGAGTDTIIGGAGNDTITGGADNDTLVGGEGADTFVFDATSGADIITDIMADDAIVFDGQEFHAEDLIFSENSEGDVEIAFSSTPDTKVTLEGVKTADLDHNNDGDLSDGYSVTEVGDQVTVTIDPQS